MEFFRYVARSKKIPRSAFGQSPQERPSGLQAESSDPHISSKLGIHGVGSLVGRNLAKKNFSFGFSVIKWFTCSINEVGSRGLGCLASTCGGLCFLQRSKEGSLPNTGSVEFTQTENIEPLSSSQGSSSKNGILVCSNNREVASKINLSRVSTPLKLKVVCQALWHICSTSSDIF
jgi:hypothetical protein